MMSTYETKKENIPQKFPEEAREQIRDTIVKNERITNPEDMYELNVLAYGGTGTAKSAVVKSGSEEAVRKLNVGRKERAEERSREIIETINETDPKYSEMAVTYNPQTQEPQKLLERAAEALEEVGANDDEVEELRVQGAQEIGFGTREEDLQKIVDIVSDYIVLIEERSITEFVDEDYVLEKSNKQDQSGRNLKAKYPQVNVFYGYSGIESSADDDTARKAGEIQRAVQNQFRKKVGVDQDQIDQAKEAIQEEIAEQAELSDEAGAYDELLENIDVADKHDLSKEAVDLVVMTMEMTKRQQEAGTDDEARRSVAEYADDWVLMEREKEYIEWSKLGEKERGQLIRNPDPNVFVLMDVRVSQMRPTSFLGIPFSNNNPRSRSEEIERRIDETLAVLGDVDEDNEAVREDLESLGIDKDKVDTLMQEGGKALGPEDKRALKEKFRDFIDDEMEQSNWIDRRVDPWAEYVKNEEAHGMIFFDEVNRASDPVLNAFLRVIHDKEIGQERVSDHVYMAGAGNLETESDQVTRFDSATTNRWQVYNQKAPKAEMWADWARRNNISPEIVNFTEHMSKYNQENILFTFDADQKETKAQFATARSWAQGADSNLKRMKVEVISDMLAQYQTPQDRLDVLQDWGLAGQEGVLTDDEVEEILDRGEDLTEDDIDNLANSDKLEEGEVKKLIRNPEDLDRRSLEGWGLADGDGLLDERIIKRITEAETDNPVTPLSDDEFTEFVTAIQDNLDITLLPQERIKELNDYMKKNGYYDQLDDELGQAVGLNIAGSFQSFLRNHIEIEDAMSDLLESDYADDPEVVTKGGDSDLIDAVEKHLVNNDNQGKQAALMKAVGSQFIAANGKAEKRQIAERIARIALIAWESRGNLQPMVTAMFEDIKQNGDQQEMVNIFQDAPSFQELAGDLSEQLELGDQVSN